MAFDRELHGDGERLPMVLVYLIPDCGVAVVHAVDPSSGCEGRSLACIAVQHGSYLPSSQARKSGKLDVPKIYAKMARAASFDCPERRRWGAYCPETVGCRRRKPCSKYGDN